VSSDFDCYLHLKLYDYVSSGSEVAKICLFSWAYSAQTVRQPPKSTTRGTSFWCRLASEMIPIAPSCAIWAANSSITNTLPWTIVFWAAMGPGIPLERNWKLFFTDVRMRKAIHVCCFKKWSKSVQDKWRKGHVAFITKKQNTFSTLGWNFWGDFPHFSRVSAHGCILTVSRITYLPGWFPVAFPVVFVFLSVLLLW